MLCDVLLVEDNDDIRSMLATLLTQERLTVAEARNGAEALSQLRCGLRPSVILLDVVMPVMSGVDFRAAQCADTSLKRIPVIAVTAATGEMVDNIDVDLVLTKPINFDVLLHVVSKLCASPHRGE